MPDCLFCKMVAGEIKPDVVYEDEEVLAFLQLKPSMALVGAVETFDNFVVRLPETIDPARYTAVVVWCESFGQFITAARYQ